MINIQPDKGIDEDLSLTLKPEQAVLSGSQLWVTATRRKRMRQIFRWFLSKKLIQIGELQAEQAIKITDSIRRIVVSEPPEPVRTFTDCQLNACQLLLFFI